MKVIGFYYNKNNKNKVKEIQIDVDKILMQTTLTLIMVNGMSTVAYAGTITESVQPIIDIFKELAEPASYAFMTKGFLSMMAGNEYEGKKTIKYAIGGYMGIQWIPKIFQIIKSINF
ncbi:hypothetical protein HYH84_12770 [Clostridium botulinum]|uniref:hypothetical protein n=1 Tax=Clostridium botulinum TaxID=1491 RepID=UPI0013FA6399|nr:hypothetical protein [Clostridium botulinum]MBY6761809.1 hypothetical protein [Clostridium botulinum]NFG27271.1 hypothetical protein [Clostridium botulinum]